MRETLYFADFNVMGTCVRRDGIGEGKQGTEGMKSKLHYGAHGGL